MADGQFCIAQVSKTKDTVLPIVLRKTEISLRPGLPDSGGFLAILRETLALGVILGI